MTWKMGPSRRQAIRAFLLAIPMCFVGAGLADDLKAPPAGVRIFYTGHSFHMFVPARMEQLAKAAGITGQRQVGAQGIGGSRVIQHWELAEGKNKAKAALETGQVDVFTMAAHLQLPDAGIEKFADLGLKHNPKMRMYVQASWMPFDQVSAEKRIKDNKERDTTNIADLKTATTEWRKRLEKQVDELNLRNGRTALYIVPVGNAVVELRAQIKDGSFPGIRSPTELFRDPIGHGLGHVQILAAYCNFAAIYGRSPVGLKIQEGGVDAAQHAILQKIAWDTVSEYKYAGVKHD